MKEKRATGNKLNSKGKMKAKLAAASPETWNEKNLPSDIERTEGEPGEVTGLLKELPSAAAAFARRRSSILVLSIVALSLLGVFWYLSKGE